MFPLPVTLHVALFKQGFIVQAFILFLVVVVVKVIVLRVVVVFGLVVISVVLYLIVVFVVFKRSFQKIFSNYQEKIFFIIITYLTIKTRKTRCTFASIT